MKYELAELINNSIMAGTWWLGVSDFRARTNLVLWVSWVITIQFVFQVKFIDIQEAKSKATNCNRADQTRQQLRRYAN